MANITIYQPDALKQFLLRHPPPPKKKKEKKFRGE